MNASVRPEAGQPALDGLDEEKIHRLVHLFYERVRDDVVLGPVFGGRIAADAWPVHLAKMCDFWSSVLLKSGRYDGRPLPPHLALGQDAGEIQFARWLALFRPTAVEVLPPAAAQAAIAHAERMAHSFRLAIGFHNGEDITRARPFAP
ncbi:group III truncated hemoglobin [Xanthobacter dioxanivorans]|uniref:Group III truncated hemoglobin n=1 Tax=Xanthobacter dioxanivorans TaxID=2528964 RepID=A0A974SI47_9HYPH|nr:group III truncated hemoglobin [Xanthobacter dioxanivorans]QRG05814.1 group III truncated hemoglobin [Xanthobacter dioxanivorans]